MKFLWESNAPWAGTGYGQQTRLMLHALQQMGHEPNCFAFYGLSGNKITWDGYTCWPNSDYDSWGNDVIQLHADRSGSQAIVTLMDLFVLNRDIWQALKQPWLSWVPIDCVGIGPMTLKLLEVCDYPVAMSNFGAQQMTEYDINVASTIYHAVDTDVFCPGDKDEARELLQLPKDAFVIAMVMANKGDRKQYPMHFEAIREFSKKNPDYNVTTFIHTDPTAQMMGWDMRVLVERAGLKGHVYTTNQYDTVVVPSPPEFMAQIYRAADVLMNCSAGEGFGIPLVEAQACGTPVIGGNYTAMPEIIVNGYAVEPESKGLGAHFGWQFHPSVDDMVYRLECVYRMLGKADAVAGREFVKMACGVEIIAQQWSDMLEIALERGKRSSKTVAELPEAYEPAFD